MTTVQATELEYIDPRANSEKFYRVFDLGDEITTQYGRIGTFGTFTPRKKGRAEKTIAGKLAKGYNVVRTGTLNFPTAPTDSELDAACSQLTTPADPIGMPTEREQSAVVIAVRETDTSVDPAVQLAVTAALTEVCTPWNVPPPTNPTRPMLAQEIRDPARIEQMLDDDGFRTQLKLDGDRVVIEVIDGQVSALNRSGQPKTKNVGAAMLEPFRHLTEGRWVFDGEVVGRTLYLFDMPAAGRFHDEQTCFDDRYLDLCLTLSLLPCGDAVQLVSTATTAETKRAMFASALSDGKEGVIFREAFGLYESGKRSSVLIKHKFINTADCFVTVVGGKGKESVTLSVYDKEGFERVVGNASTIGKSPAPKLGDVWETNFLYVISHDHPKMVQPRLMRIRTDKTADECFIEQFVGAVTDKKVSTA